MKTITTLIWRDFATDPPRFNGHLLVAVRDSETDATGRLSTVEAEKWDGKITASDSQYSIEGKTIVLWAEMPWPSIREPARPEAMSSAELWQAIVRGGLDLSLCMDCGKPVVCLPDGLPCCEECGERESERQVRS